jgi:hypothetical protein
VLVLPICPLWKSTGKVSTKTGLRFIPRLTHVGFLATGGKRTTYIYVRNLLILGMEYSYLSFICVGILSMSVIHAIRIKKMEREVFEVNLEHESVRDDINRLKRIL